jgi:16S rRNA (guanine527-N7)-methyltransferase
VLAIVRPEIAVVLIDATKKKAAFLRETAVALGLKNVAVLDQRGEDVAQGEMRETFDVATARAVGAMSWVAEWCLPLLKVGGKLLAMKGQKAQEDLLDAKRAIRLLGGGPPIVHPVQLPGTEHRVIVEIMKIGPTPARFPRRSTEAKGRAIT